MNEATLRDVKAHMMDDFEELLPPKIAPDMKLLNKTVGMATLELARTMLLKSSRRGRQPFGVVAFEIEPLCPLSSLLKCYSQFQLQPPMMSALSALLDLRLINSELGWTWITFDVSIESAIPCGWDGPSSSRGSQTPGRARCGFD